MTRLKKVSTLLLASLTLTAAASCTQNIVSSDTTPTTNKVAASTEASEDTSGTSTSNIVDVADATATKDFMARFDSEAKTYQGAIKMLFLALLEIEKNPEQAEVFLSAVYNGKSLSADSSSPTGFTLGNSELFILDQMKKKPEIARSYVGGTPDKSYADFDSTATNISYPEHDTVVNGIRINNTIEGNTKGQVYIQSSGKDLPTRIDLEQNGKGLFKVSPASVTSIATGVKKAAVQDF